VTQKTVITKSRFKLTQNFSYIRSSLCSRHLQSFKSVLQKLCFTGAQKCAPNEICVGCDAFSVNFRQMCSKL